MSAIDELRIAGEFSDRGSNSLCASPGTAGNLAIYVTRSVDPDRITCFDSPAGAPSIESCTIASALFSNVAGQKRFGPAGKPSVDVDVPRGWVYRDSSGRDCSIVLNTKNGAVVSTSWQRLWLAAASIAAMCVRQRRSGIYQEYGKQGFLLAALPVLLARIVLMLFTVEGSKEIFIGLFKEGAPHVDTASF